MKMTQRHVTLTLFSLLSIGTLLILVSLLLRGSTQALLTAGSAFLLQTALLIAYWLGWEPTRYIALIAQMLLIAFMPPGSFSGSGGSLVLVIPPAQALILAGPAWVIATAVINYAILLLRADGRDVYSSPVVFLLYVIVVGSILLGRLIADSAQRAAEANARRAEEEKVRVEQQAQELAEANEQVRFQLDQQLRTRDLVMTLETPVVPLAEEVLFAPIVGHMDARRADALTARLLQEASAQHTRLVVLDIAGVATMDTAVVRALLNMAQALRLLGCEVTISGISASVALSLINLKVDLTGVRTARNPQEALAHYLEAPTPTPNK